MTSENWALGTGCASNDVVASFCFTSLKAFSWISFSEICSFFFFLLRNRSERGDEICTVWDKTSVVVKQTDEVP